MDTLNNSYHWLAWVTVGQYGRGRLWLYVSAGWPWRRPWGWCEAWGVPGKMWCPHDDGQLNIAPSLFHSLVNTKVGQIRVKACKQICQFLSLQVSPAGLVCAPTGSSGPCSDGGNSSTRHISCSLTDSLCVWWKVLSCGNHPASTTQFSTFAERRTVLATFGESGWR